MARRGSKKRLEGFHFTRAIRTLCTDMTERLPELEHIAIDRVAIGFCQARKNVPHGLQASLTPLRFEQGATTKIERGRRYGCETILDPEGHEYLYLLNFYLPRFLNHSLGEKLTTVIHELWHISEAFDGDLRRHEGRCYVHGPSQREFDRTASRLAAAWLAMNPPAETYAFLRLRFPELQAKYGHVCGERYRTPKLVPLSKAS